MARSRKTLASSADGAGGAGGTLPPVEPHAHSFSAQPRSGRRPCSGVGSRWVPGEKCQDEYPDASGRQRPRFGTFTRTEGGSDADA